MKILRLSEIVGHEILELRYHYVSENEYGLQSFYAYIKLSGDIIISIPNFDDDEYLNLTKENLNYFSERFNTGQLVNEKAKSYFVGQKIIDFYFSYYNGEIDIDFPAIIKLSNNYYLTEINYGPPGIYVDLSILDERQFQAEVKRRNDAKVEVRSFNQMKNAS